MLTVSNELKNAFMKDERTIYVRIKIGNRTFDNNNVISVDYDAGSLSGEVFAIGSTYSNSIKITFSELVEGLKELDEVTYEIGIKLANGKIEYVPMGVFVINDAIEMDRNNNKTTIECMDRMVMLGGAYVSSLSYPAAIREVALEIANKAGVQVADTFDRLNADIIAKPEGYTYREAIGLIAQFEAGFATFNRYGKLEIRTLSDPNFAIPPDNYFSKGLVKNEVFFRLGGISCTTDDSDTVIQSGNTAGNQVVLENGVMTKFLLDKIYQKIQTINYYPFSLSWQGNPVLEAGDWVEVEDLKGNKFKTPNLSYSLSFNGGLSAKSSAETVTQSDATYQYKSPLQQKIEWIHARIDAAGGNVVYEGIDEPVNPKEGDLWFKIIGPDKEILIYKKDKDGNLFWDSQISTADIDKVAKEVEEAIEQIKEAEKSANDAVEKADQAIEEAGFAKVDAGKAKEDATKAISDASKAVTEAGTALSTANTAKTNAGTALTTAQTSLTNSGTALTSAEKALKAYDDLEIGGRNLLLDSNNPKNWSSTATYKEDYAELARATSTGSRVAMSFKNDKVPTLPPREIYTLSVEVYIDSSVNYTNGATVFLRYMNSAGSLNDRFVIALNSVEKDKWVKVSASDDVLSSYPIFGNFQTAMYSGRIRVRRPKIEKGNKATDWTPAPEDVQVQITDINGELSRKVAQTTFDTLNGTVQSQSTKISQNQSAIGLKADKTVTDIINQTVAKHTTDIKATADGLAMKAEKALVDSLNGTVATHTSQIKATADGLGLKADKSLVDTVKGTVDTHTTQIKATSDGLALKAEKSLVDTINGTVNTHTSQIKATSDGLGLKADKTLVDTIKGTVDKHTTDIKANADGLKLKAEASAVSTLTGTVNTHTNQISANATAISARLTSAQVDSLVTGKNYVNQTTLNATANGLSTQITQVNTDLKTTNTKITSIEATVNGIQTTVASKADKSQVTQLSNAYDVLVSNVSQNMLPNGAFSSGLGGWAIGTNMTGVIEGDYLRAYNNASDNTTTSTANRFWAGNVNLTAGNAYHIKFKARAGFTYDISVGQAGGKYLKRFTLSTEWKEYSFTYEASSANAFSVFLHNGGTYFFDDFFVTESGGASTGQLSVMNDNINLRVQKGDVIGQINVEAGKTLIQNKSLYLDAATVTFSGKAFIPSAAITELSVDKLNGGIANFAKFNAININVSSLVGNITNFVQSNWNDANSSIGINASGLTSTAGSLSTTLNAGQLTTKSGTKSGTVNALGMEIYDSSNGQTTKLHSNGIEFKWYDVIRGITQHSEGLEIRPTTGSGARLNSALHLITGSGNDKVAYLQLGNPDGGTNSRLEMKGTQLSLRHPNGGSLDIADYAYDGRMGRINSGKFRTTTTDGRGIQMEVSQISALAGNQTIYIMPSGTGELRIGNGSANPTLWPVRASQFIQGSSRNSKTNIANYEKSALNVLNGLQVVTYNRKDELARGVVYESIGFIAEDSPAISVLTDGNPAGVDQYKMVSLAIKAIQELNARISIDSVIPLINANTNVAMRALTKTERLENRVKLLEEKISKLESVA